MNTLKYTFFDTINKIIEILSKIRSTSRLAFITYLVTIIISYYVILSIHLLDNANYIIKFLTILIILILPGIIVISIFTRIKSIETIKLSREIIKSKQKELDKDLVVEFGKLIRTMEHEEGTIERLRRFLEILDKNGLLSIEEIERSILNRERILIMIVAQEGLFYQHSTLKNKFDEFLKITKGYTLPGDTLISAYLEHIVKKWDNVEFVSKGGVKLTGTASYVLFLYRYRGGFIKKLMEEYINYVHSIIEEFKKSKYYDTLDKNDKDHLNKWLKDFKFPRLVISVPYVVTVKDLHGFVPLDELLIEDLNKKLREKLRIGGIKFAYLFEASGFNKFIVKRIEDIEENIRNTLKIGNIIEFLSLADPYNKLLNSIKNIDKELYNEITKYNKLLIELKLLINDLVKIAFLRKEQ